MSKYGKKIKDKLAPLGRAVRLTGAARFYHDGDGAGFVWRWWHPVAWVCAPIAFCLQCLIVGVPDAWAYREDVGLRLKPWFAQHPEHLEWE